MTITLQVYPELNPRIIEVKAPTTEVTVQEFYRAVRQWEDEPSSVSYPSLISGAGGEDLGGSVSVGYTMTLQNAKIMFQARTTPLDNGSGRTCDLTNSQGLQLYVDDADFISAGVYVGATVVNLTTGERATVTEVVDANTINHFRLTGAGAQGWTSGNEYMILPNVLCSITGGNLVAVDSNGDAIDVVFPSPNVQVVRSSSSSGTIAELETIQYASFQNSVWLDVTSSNSGTAYPVGNREYPVNNLTDAVAIANSKGFAIIQVLTDCTLDSGTNLTDFTIIGQSMVNTNITISSDALTTGVTIKCCNVSGYLDGNSNLDGCMVGDLTYVNGHIRGCGLYGTIILDGNEDAILLDCSESDPNSLPIIDMNGSGQNLVMNDWSGSITIKNLTSATETVAVQIDGGNITLDSTITAGKFRISGIGTLTNNSTSYTSLNTDGLMSKETLTEITWDAVYIDTTNGTSGTAFPIGTAGTPVDNIADARTIANNKNISRYYVKGSITLDQSYTRWEFIGVNSITSDSVNLNGQTISLCKFVDLSLSGSCTSSTIQCQRCYLTNVSGIAGSLLDSAVIGTLTLGGAGSILGALQLRGGTTPTIIDVNGANRIFQASLYGGIFQIINSQAGSIVQLGCRWMESVTLDASNTGGTAILLGNGTLTDNSSMSVTETLFNVEGIVEDVWAYER